MTTARRPVLLILASAFLAQAAIGISLVAFPWLVLQGGGGATDAAIVAGAASLPLVVATIAAGTAADFMGRRPVAILSDAFSAAAVIAVPLLVIASGPDTLTTPVLAGLAALGAWFDPAGMTGRRSMLPEGARQAGWTLDRANSLYATTFELAYIVGPGIGGLLIATVGGTNTMWVTGALFALSFAVMVLLRLDGVDKADPQSRPEGVVSGVVEGLRFVWRDPVLRALGLIDLVIFGLTLPMESVLFPKFFADQDEPAELGWVLMAFSLGGLVGALSWTALSRVASRRLVVVVSTIITGLAGAGLAFLPPLPAILALVALVGVVNGPIAPIYGSVMFSRAPVNLRGRVVGVMTSMSFAAGPIGFAVAGPLADTLGLKVAFLALSVPIVVLGVACPLIPALGGLDTAETVDSAS
jgi:MFS family permease